MFESKFENIYEYEDGSEALNAYRRYLPSYVFMDVQMKFVDGISATREIIQSFPDARIIILTGYNGRIKNEAISAGAFAYVPKDNLTELFDIIQ
jgi:DNA-binding NarL/FixJ family response regulator